MHDPTFLTRIVLRNYKSIAACDVRMRPLMFLVDPNGSGKSNFLDALRFVADALRTSLDHALRDRGGIKEVRRRSGGHPNHFGLRLEFVLRAGAIGHYALRVGARPQGGYEVQNEECVIRGAEVPTSEAYFRVHAGQVSTNVQVAPVAPTDRLYLVNASGIAEFRPVYEAFSHMGFYNLNPDRIRDLQTPDAGQLLVRDGSNLASVLARLESHNNTMKRRIEEYLAKIVPGVQGVNFKVIGPKETLEFRQQIAGSRYPWRFLAANMSDGTLRALGVLVALFQSANSGGTRVPLIGIEEPEVACILQPPVSFLIVCETPAIAHRSLSPAIVRTWSMMRNSILNRFLPLLLKKG